MKRRLLVALSLTLPVLLLCCRLHPDWGREKHLAQIDAVVTEEIGAGHVPGAVVLVGRSNRILYAKTFGLAVAEPFEAPMHEDTVFDLASLSKPVSTATCIMILADRNELSLDDYVRDYLPAFACGGKEEARIEHLLAHTSGLPAYTNAAALKEQYGSPCPDKVVEKICGLEAAGAPGEEFCYSCLGYIILARIVEIATGHGIDEFASENIFAPLGMKHTTYNPPASWQDRIAATEIVDGELLRGTVHDPLARLMGGVSGNAGVFSTARDLSIYCRMLLNGGRWKGRQILSAAAVKRLTTVHSHGRALGFDVSSGYAWIKGPYASPEAFCHSGYTGTSLVCDPANDTYVIILTNRAHPADGGTSKPIRTKIAEVVFQPYARDASL
jgi:CubicO group peptidase (beta-lactamase class C family)